MCVSFDVTVFTLVTINIPKINDIKAGKKIILKFDMPAIFIAITSSDWTKFKNNMIDEIKKICLIAHTCYKSWDLAYKCIKVLIDKEYISFKAIKEYHKIISNELTKKWKILPSPVRR